MRSFGISSELVSIGLGTALKVTRVEPGSPAANAGIEVDDVLTKANGASLTSPAELATAYRSTRGALTLTVRDVRTGGDVLVDIRPGAVRRDSNVTATPSRKRLGVTTELAFYEGAAVVKVTEVERQSPAQRAGVVPGLLILTANGKPISDPNKLVAAERSATRTLRLEVVDPRDRRRRVVNVEL